MDNSTRLSGCTDCTPHTEKRIRRRLSSRCCNMKRKRATYYVTSDFKGLGY